MRDYRFHCEDCDSYSQCQYYHNRKGTSLICKEFQHGSSVIERIRDEIEQCKGKWNDTSPDTCFDIVLQIIDKYIK